MATTIRSNRFRFFISVVLSSSLAAATLAGCAAGAQLGLGSFGGSSSTSGSSGSSSDSSAADSSVPATQTITPSGSSRDHVEEYKQEMRIQEALRDVWFMDENEKTLASASTGNGPGMVADGAACAKAAAALLASGVSPTYEIRDPQGRTVALGKAKQAVCDPVSARAATWEARIASAQSESNQKIAAPLKAAGITGDRLALLIRHDGYEMLGAGGRTLGTPKALKHASLIFETLRLNDGTWTVRRYEFEGDTLVGTTEQGYRLQPGATAFQ